MWPRVGAGEKKSSSGGEWDMFRCWSCTSNVDAPFDRPLPQNRLHISVHAASISTVSSSLFSFPVISH